MNILEIVIRVAISFLVLLVLTRIMGRKEISQMTFFNFVSAITIGTLSGALVTDQTLSMGNGLIALLAWSIFTITIGLMTIKSKKTRQIIDGEPVIVIKNGKIMEDALRKVRLDMDSLTASLREKDIFSLMDVEYAIFETDGKLSIMKKENKLPLTKSDMNIDKPKKDLFPLATEVIVDGVINTNNLAKLNLDRKWLYEKLQQLGVQSISEVFYAEIQKNGQLFIDTKNDAIQ
ncbi:MULTISPECIES: DUF421 domain-containing protein [Priestia]|jgi:uncharacterized membrane protein YcaP (DUF421 family)|uniref:DUF421 domain-containing protein n=1 Tax=Priestia TaxID=2800373 RepID=UPI0011AAC55A|nr:DUF421 domain-containing protein [Priestia megaterium]MBK0009638.1 DUF421 domain-containing protein [Bacillus sp. S35]MBU8756943.1 DUF421 domain-containing protein [Priestia megaterium]